MTLKDGETRREALWQAGGKLDRLAQLREVLRYLEASVASREGEVHKRFFICFLGLDRLCDRSGRAADARQRLRDEKARPVWDELRSWLDRRVRRQAPPLTQIGEALGYLDNQWPLLIRVLDDGRIEVENNKCENAIRPSVIGRNAWLFLDTPAGAEASARRYSLIVTAKACGQEPYAYLALVFTELPKATTLAQVEALLPWAIARPATHSVAA